MPLVNRSSFPYIYLVLAAAMWGIATPVIKFTVGYVPPFTFLMIRFVIAAIILLPYTVHILKTVSINKKRFRNLFLVALIGHVITLSLIFIGLSKTTSIEGAVISSLTPLTVTLMAAILIKEVIKKHEIEGLLIALVGTLVIIFYPLVSSSEITIVEELSFLGNLIFLGGVFTDAFGTILLKERLSNDKIITPSRYIALIYPMIALMFIPLGIGEQYKMYKHENTIGKTMRLCNIKDFDLGNYTLKNKCDDNGCYSIKNSNEQEYFCKTPKTQDSFSSFFNKNMKEYLTYPGILGIIYMAIFSGILAYMFYSIGLKHITAGEASMFYYLQPLFGIPLSVLFLGESANILFLVGGGLILFGIFKSERKETQNMLKS